MKMVDQLKVWISNNKTLYDIYYVIGSLALNVLKYIVPVDDKLILFSSFSGKKYGDNPRAIYEQMLQDERFAEWKFIWAFTDISKFPDVKCSKVCVNSFSYFVVALRARCWIADVGIERGLSFKGRNVFYLHTWHGTPIKKIGQDMISGKGTFKTNVKKWKIDVLLAQGNYEKEVYSHAFGIPLEKIKITGLPRNDSLLKYSQSDLDVIRKRLHITSGKKIILYAPTFRDFGMEKDGNCVFAPPIDLKKWESKLSADYVVLFRAHQAVNKVLNVVTNSFIHNVSDYSSLNDLMAIADILISDYSGVLFDFSITGKPMLCFSYDYDKYVQERGVYFDIRKELVSVSDEDQLLDTIINTKNTKNDEKTICFREKFVSEYGAATLKSLDIIYQNINI